MNFTDKLVTSAAILSAVVLAVEAGFTRAEVEAVALVSVVGLCGGLIRFMRSSKHWKWRVVAGASLLGAGFGFALTAIYYQDTLHAYRWQASGYSFLIGFASPELTEYIGPMVLRLFGSRFQMESK